MDRPSWCFIAVCTLFFFFFQAEDGIRDLTVTGVQTCALPIYRLPDQLAHSPGRGVERIQLLRLEQGDAARGGALEDRGLSVQPSQLSGHRLAQRPRRSEERRVGKEGRSRWSPYH